jgi:ubiquinol-cytochrome c reductase cytochrome c1 subunit
MRPGKLSDYFPNPYANEEAARAAPHYRLDMSITAILGVCTIF